MSLEFTAAAPANARDLGAWMQSIATHAQAAMLRQDLPIEAGPVSVYAFFRLPWPKSRRLPAECPPHQGTPHLDQLERALLEALKGVVYKSGRQIVRKEVGKIYQPPELGAPRVYISVVAL